MADCGQDIDAYLKGDGKGHSPFFIISPDWTPQDYEEVCDRIQNACTQAGISFRGNLPRFSTRNGRVASNTGYHQRIALEKLLFERYNQDNLFSLPHQRNPTIPRPSWFQDYMLIPGPHSIGQKLLLVSFRRIKDKILGRRGTHAEVIEQGEQQAHRTSSPAESENTLTTPDITSMSSASAEEDIASAEQPSLISAVANIRSEPAPDNLRPKHFEDLTIYIGTIVELDRGQLIMRKTLRDPQNWFESSAPGPFDFGKVRRSVGAPAGWETELFFFPDTSQGPHTILDEEELLGSIQHLYKLSAKGKPIRSISLFVAADIDHVRALSLDQRDLSNQVSQTVTMYLGDP